MRAVFFGTPGFAVPSLRALAEEHDVALVVTREDAVRARGKELVASPVAIAADELGLPVAKLSRIDGDAIELVRDADCEIGVVAAFGRILPDELLGSCPRGFINVHASLLPRWRGAAPIQRAILAGDAELGVSIMRLVHEMDAGDYCLQASTPASGKDAATLTSELADLGAQALIEALRDMEAGTAIWTEQDDSLVTFAPKVTKQEMLLDPADGAKENLGRVLASLDTAPARCSIGGKGVRVLDACYAGPGLHGGSAGDVVIVDGGPLLICSDGALRITQVKPDGKRAMDAADWARGIRGASTTWARV
ncbi:MAG: methionyl-tRNA formyltransferase [Atopobiaceae bacterium]|nr:methionyl-tRNA formyltransferase [Atopobiaceae bacterium]